MKALEAGHISNQVNKEDKTWWQFWLPLNTYITQPSCITREQTWQDASELEEPNEVLPGTKGSAHIWKRDEKDREIQEKISACHQMLGRKTLFSIFLSAMLDEAFRNMGDGIYIQSRQSGILIVSYALKVSVNGVMCVVAHFRSSGTSESV